MLIYKHNYARSYNRRSPRPLETAGGRPRKRTGDFLRRVGTEIPGENASGARSWHRQEKYRRFVLGQPGSLRWRPNGSGGPPRSLPLPWKALIFVDTAAFLALYMKRDQYHRQASRIFSSLARPFSTSNHVVDELATLLGRIAGCHYAADRVADLYASPSIDVLSSTRDDEIEAIRWMRKYADKGISFTDCISFSMMRRLRIRWAFTFDRHFRDAGFEIINTPQSS